MIGALFAGLFVAAFGATGTWFLAVRFPSAKFLRLGYALMSGGGLFFAIWALSKIVAVGIVATALLGAGGAVGAVGALRKELRSG